MSQVHKIYDDIKYVLSDAMNYADLICGDTGPPFAADYGWECVSLAQIGTLDNAVCVVDPWVRGQEELVRLAEAIKRYPFRFVLRLIDCGWENQDAPWYRFYREMIDAPQVHFMFTYAPAEITSFFLSLMRRSRHVIAPYLYRIENERPIDHSKRVHRVLISGKPIKSYYPLRTQAFFYSKYVPPFSMVSDIQRHPGWSRNEIKTLEGVKLGEDYLDLLTKYRFAFVCSARTRSEFLKYREFAYAGVTPIGDMPYSLLDCPLSAFVPWRRNFIALSKQIANSCDSEPKAREFRAYMLQRRDRTKLTSAINDQLLDFN